jgi:hypothetical protein
MQNAFVGCRMVRDAGTTERDPAILTSPVARSTGGRPRSAVPDIMTGPKTGAGSRHHDWTCDGGKSIDVDFGIAFGPASLVKVNIIP